MHPWWVKYSLRRPNVLHLLALLLCPALFVGCSDPTPPGGSTPGESTAAPSESSQADVARRDLAAALFAEDRFADCLETLRPLVERKQPHVWDLDAAGIAASNLNDPDAARDFFERALAVNPDSPVPHYNLGQLEFSEGELEAATRLLEIFPGPRMPGERDREEAGALDG